MKNYFKLAVIIILCIGITVLGFNIYNNLEDRKGTSSYILNHEEKISNIEYKEVSNYLTELSGNSFLYLTYIGDKDIYNLEKELVKSLRKNELTESFIYINGTSEINKEKKISSLSDTLKITTKDDIVLPAIIYYQNNKPKDYIDSSHKMITVADFDQLIEKYELNK